MNTQVSLDRSIAPVLAATPTNIWREVVVDEERFSQLSQDWNRIVASTASKTALHDWQYLTSWWATFGRRCPTTGRRGELHILVVHDGGEVVAILPFFAYERPRLSLLPKRLRPMGYAGWLEPYDLTEEPLTAVQPGYEPVVLDEAAIWLKEGLGQASWDCCVLAWFGHEAQPDGGDTWQRFRRKPGPAHVALPESWDRFRKGLSKSMRDNLPYYGRLLSRQGHAWHVEIAELGPDWHRAVGEFIRLHRLRACMSNDPDRVDHLNTPAHREFLNAVHDALREDSRAFIGMLRVDGQVVSAQLFLDDGHTLVMSYSGYDQAWSRFSPLLVLQAEVIKQGIARGNKRLDLLCGEAQWQERWQPTRDFPINKLTLASKRPMATFRCANYVLVREFSIYWHKCRLSRWMKRSRLLSSLQSFGQAIYFGQARHSHLLVSMHRLRVHI